MVAKRDFIFSTESYYPDPIKSQERLCRGYSQKLTVDGPATRKPLPLSSSLQMRKIRGNCVNYNCCEYVEAR